MMKARISTAGAALAGGIALMAGALGSATGALAQYYPHPHVYGGFYGGPAYLAPPVPRHHVVHAGAHLRGAGDIQSNPLDAFIGLGVAGDRQIGGHDARTGLRQRFTDGAANAARTTRHQGHAARHEIRRIHRHRQSSPTVIWRNARRTFPCIRCFQTRFALPPTPA